jgi:hypothetical protein
MNEVLNDKNSFYDGLTQTMSKLTFFTDMFQDVRLQCRKVALSVPVQVPKFNFAEKNSRKPAYGYSVKAFGLKNNIGGRLFKRLLKIRRHNHIGKVEFNSIISENNAALLQYPQKQVFKI